MLHSVVTQSQHKEAAVGEPKAVSLVWGEYLLGQSKRVAIAAEGTQLSVSFVVKVFTASSLMLYDSCAARLCSGLSGLH